MVKNRAVMTATLGFLLIASCSSEAPFSRPSLAPLGQEAALDDFNQMVISFKGLYGLMQFKEKRFGLNFDAIVKNSTAEIRAARTDEEVFGAYRRFVANFHDGHVSITFPYSSGKIKRYTIPMYAAPFGATFAVASLEPEMAQSGVTVGDEILAMDGQTPEEWLKIINRYMTWGNERSDRNNICLLFSRDAFMTEMVPEKSTTLIRLKRADKTEYEITLEWKTETYYKKSDATTVSAVAGKPLAYGAHAERMNLAAGTSKFKLESPRPFFVTPALATKFALHEVTIDREHLAKYQLDPDKDHYDEVYAATYVYAGRTFLMIRQPTYHVDQDDKVALLLRVYRAILDQYENQVTALVIDQNHNPGGYLNYALAFFKLFIDQPEPNLIEAPKADRKWITDLLDYAKNIDPNLQKPEAARLAGYAAAIETANDRGETLSPFITWTESWYIKPDGSYTWKKPIMILADELSGSCADIFPMLMTRSHRAKLFGQRTTGLGGSVEQVASLAFSQAKLDLTRGLFNSYRDDGSYGPGSWIENTGIEPDYSYPMTIDELRNDFVPYFTQMNTFMLETLGVKS